MADFEIRAIPVQAWGLELRGSERIQFNGRMMAECMGEALQCASANGCMEPGAVGLTDGCGETLRRHNDLVGCGDAGFGIRVKHLLNSPMPGRPGGPGMPKPTGGPQPGAADVDWLPGE